MKEITIIYQSNGFQNLNMQFILEDRVKLDLTNSAKITTTFMILFVSWRKPYYIFEPNGDDLSKMSS